MTSIESEAFHFIAFSRDGRTIASIETTALVDTRDLTETRHTMTRIISEELRAGRPCTEPQALAAAFSVPQGAPLTMALLNVGPLPSDDVVAVFSAWQARERSNVRAFRRGPRY